MHSLESGHRQARAVAVRCWRECRRCGAVTRSPAAPATSTTLLGIVVPSGGKSVKTAKPYGLGPGPYLKTLIVKPDPIISPVKFLEVQKNSSCVGETTLNPAPHRKDTPSRTGM